MFITGRNLLQAPFLTTDMVCFQIVDATIDTYGQTIEKLIVKKLNSNYRFDEYLLPVSAENINFVDDRAYINKTLEDIEKYKYPADSFYIALKDNSADVHLLSQLMRFKGECMDEALGSVHDVIIDPDTFSVRYYTVRISHTIFKKWAFIPVNWMDKIDWTSRVVNLAVERNEIVSWALYPPQTFMTESVEKDLLARTRHIGPQKSAPIFNDDFWQWISHDI